MKKLLSLALAAILALSVAACSTPPQSSSAPMAPSSSEQASSMPATAITQDRAGNTITIPTEINTIISMAASVTQQLTEMGVADKIIAVDTQSPLVSSGLKDDILQMDMFTPDVEQIVALKPDVVFVTTMSAAGGKDPFEPVRNAGICVIAIPSSSSIEGVMQDVQFVADCVGEREKGMALVKAMEETFASVREKAKAITAKKTVLFEIASAPEIYSFGSDVFLNEMIEAIGAENLLAEQSGWLAVTEESAVAKNPDVILTNVNYIEKPTEEIMARKGWQEVTAIKNSEVYYIDNTSSNLPNHHITDALLEMAKAVYPDVFA